MDYLFFIIKHISLYYNNMMLCYTLNLTGWNTPSVMLNLLQHPTKKVNWQQVTSSNERGIA
jgi:hypothetical protein